MDEPLGALDALTREQMQELILDVWARTGKSVFFITHGIDEAVFLASKLLVMSPRPGRVVASLDLGFGRQFAAGAKSGDVRSQPEFVAMRERVKGLIFSSRQVDGSGVVSNSSRRCFVSRSLRAPAISGLGLGRVCGRVGYVSRVSIATSVVLLLLWQLAASLEVVPAMFMPSPFAVAAKFVAVSRDGFQDATLLEHLLASVGRVTAALVAAVILGVDARLRHEFEPDGAGRRSHPILEFYRPIPPLAYLPLVIIWFGIGEFAKVLVIFLGILPSIVIATNEGLRSVSPDRVNAARSLGATPGPGGVPRAPAPCHAEHPYRHAHWTWRRLGDARRGRTGRGDEGPRDS